MQIQRGGIKVSWWVQAHVSKALAELNLPRVVTRSQVEFEIGIRTRNNPPSQEMKQQVSAAICRAKFRKNGKDFVYRRQKKSYPRFELVEVGVKTVRQAPIKEK